MEMDVGARVAEPADLELVTALVSGAVRSLRSERGGQQLLERELSDFAGSPSELSDVLRAYLYPAGDHLAVVGEVDGVAVGLALVRFDETQPGPRVATVEAVYVETEARGVGVGESILAEVSELAGTRGASSIDAYALPGMSELKNFFESAGFVARLLTMRGPVRR